MELGPTVVVAALVALRLLPSALLLPVLGGPLAPWSARAALTGMAALALALVQPPEVAAAVARTPLLGLAAIGIKELAVGSVLALVAAAPLLAADVAGRWIGGAIGPADASAAAGVAGPTRSTGLLTSLIAVLVFFAIDGHLIVIGALARSYDAAPLLGSFDRAAATREVLAAILSLLAAATALAAPALVAGALVDLALGLALRAGVGGGAGVAGVAGVRAAAVVAFVAAGLALLAVAIAHDAGTAARALERVVTNLAPG